MNPQSGFWRRGIYRFILFGTGLFVALTVIAMLLFPGGTVNNEPTRGYDFFRNFFSDLGRWRAVDGRSNLPSFLPFFLALNMAGLALIFFFLAFPRFFEDRPWTRRLSRLGSAAGALSGLCFMGVAFTPYDLFLVIHKEFVFWAFRLFLAAVACYVPVLFAARGYPRRAGWIFAFFALCLAGYLWLLFEGPSAKTAAGLVIQATGQKVIVYVSILSVMAQSWVALRVAQRASEAE